MPSRYWKKMESNDDGTTIDRENTNDFSNDGTIEMENTGSNSSSHDQERRHRGICFFTHAHPTRLLLLVVVGLIFAFTSMTVSFVQVKRSYATSPAPYSILVGGLTSTSVQLRVKIDDDDDEEDQLFVLSDHPNIDSDDNDDDFLWTWSFNDKNVDNEATTTSSSTTRSSSKVNNIITAKVTLVYSGIYAVSLSNLKPNKQYYYALRESSSMLQGRFKTPVPEGQRMNFTIALSSDTWAGSRHSVFDDIAKQKPDLFLHLGDFHYKDIADNDIDKRLNAISTTLASQPQAKLYRQTSLVYMWDDHDWLGNDALGFNEEHEKGARDTALQSYQIAFPHYPLAAAAAAAAAVTEEENGGSSSPNSISVSAIPPYHAFTFGSVRFIISDLRSEATEYSIFSETQKTWLQRELADVDKYDFVIWVTTKPWIGESEPGEDPWWGHPDDRQQVSDWISNNNATTKNNLLAVSGDAHMLAFDDGTNTYYGNNDDTGVAYSFPILHVGPLDRRGNVKGGPFTVGCHAIKYKRNHNYAVIDFEFPAAGNDGDDDENDDDDNDACMTIRGYAADKVWTKMTTSTKPVLQKHLCGANIFSESQIGVRVGSCNLQKVSVSALIFFVFAVVATLIASIFAASGSVGSGGHHLLTTSRRREYVMVLTVLWIFLMVTLAVGVEVPLAKGITQFDLLPFTILIFLQSIAFLLVMGYSSSKKTNDHREKEGVGCGGGGGGGGGTPSDSERDCTEL